MQSPQTGLEVRVVSISGDLCNISHLEDCCLVCGGLGRSLHLLLLLKSPEVVLDEESCIELSNRHVIVN